MKQILISREFKFVGSCNCHGVPSSHYEHANHPGLRMEIADNNTQFWVRKRTMPNPNYSTIDFGAVGRFDEAMKKYFTL